MCKFDQAWVGKCKNEDVQNEKYCVCGEQATHTCPETFQFVCGAPLCDNCEHEIAENGTNGGTCSHCKKDEQKYKSWIER